MLAVLATVVAAGVTSFGSWLSDVSGRRLRSLSLADGLLRTGGPHAMLLHASAYESLSRLFPWRRRWIRFVAILFWMSVGVLALEVAPGLSPIQQVTLYAAGMGAFALGLIRFVSVVLSGADAETIAKEILRQKRDNAIDGFVDQHGEIREQLRVQSMRKFDWKLRRLFSSNPVLQRRIRRLGEILALVVILAYVIMVVAVLGN